MVSLRIKIFEEALKRYESGNPEFTAKEMADLSGNKIAVVRGKLFQLSKESYIKKIGEKSDVKYMVCDSKTKKEAMRYMIDKHRKEEYNERKEMIEGSKTA